MEPFYGRTSELAELGELKRKKSASLVVVMGRRRIGKSRLIQEFSAGFKSYYYFEGNAPGEGETQHKRGAQLANFADQIHLNFGFHPGSLRSWAEAFSLLAKLIKKTGRTLLFFDEISWMAHGSASFADNLKTAWDKEFKQNSRLILALVGSVTFWIDKNILRNTAFYGRVSKVIHLGPLPLADAGKYWRGSMVSPREKLKVLMVTGGVPKYLEEVITAKDADENIKSLCFSRSGYLFDEYRKIFLNIFGKKADTYRRIVEVLQDGSLNGSDIAKAMGKTFNGHITDYLADLEKAGFIAAFHSWDLKTQAASLDCCYRISDNYLRFYLRYIQPHRARIEQDLFRYTSLDSMMGWDAVVGFQFENLVLGNLDLVLRSLGLAGSRKILAAGPFRQSQTNRRRGCQIDLLIQTESSLYICEIKFRKRLGSNVVDEMREKIARLKTPRDLNRFPVLIYGGGDLADSVRDEEYFSHLVKFEDYLAG